MVLEQSGNNATANIGAFNDVGRDQYNTTRNETFQDSVYNNAKVVGNKFKTFLGRGNIVVNKSGDVINSVSNTKNGDSYDNSQNTSYINSFPHPLPTLAREALSPTNNVNTISDLDSKHKSSLQAEENLPDSLISKNNFEPTDARSGKTLSPVPVLNEVDKYGDNVLTPRAEENSMSLPIEREKPVLAINTSNTTKMANTGDNTSTGSSTPPIATPDSAPQSLTVKIKLVSHGGDGVAIRIPYYYSPLLSLVEDENGACSVSIACPSLELSVSPTQFYAPPAQAPYSGTKSPDDRIVTLSSRNTSNSRLTSPSKDDHICQCTCLLQEKTELKTTITTTEIEGPWISQQPANTKQFDFSPSPKTEGQNGDNLRGGYKLQEKGYRNKTTYTLYDDFCLSHDGDEGDAGVSFKGVSKLIETVLDTVNPPLELVYELYRCIQQQNIMAEDIFYVVKGYTRSGIFRASILAGDCEDSKDTNSCTISLRGLLSALEYYHGNRLVTLCQEECPDGDVEPIPDPLSPVESRSPSWDKYPGQGVGMADVRHRLVKQLRKLTHYESAEGFYVVAVGRGPGIYISQEEYSGRISGLSWGMGKRFGPDSREDAENWYRSLLIQKKIKARN